MVYLSFLENVTLDTQNEYLMLVTSKVSSQLVSSYPCNSSGEMSPHLAKEIWEDKESSRIIWAAFNSFFDTGWSDTQNTQTPELHQFGFSSI